MLNGIVQNIILLGTKREKNKFGRGRIVKFINYVTNIGVIIAIVVTAILNFTDLIPDEQVVGYLLCAVGAIAIEIFISFLKNEKTIKEIITPKSLSEKVTRKTHYKMLNKAAIDAESEIWIMTIDSALSSQQVSTIPERKVYYDTIKNIAKRKNNVSIRRIYGLPKEDAARKDKIEWIKKDLDKIKDCSNLHIRVFDWKVFESIPAPLSLQIVDDKFVGLVNLKQSSKGVEGGGEDLCIFDSNIVQHMKHYYEAVWDKCVELKSGNNINENVLK